MKSHSDSPGGSRGANRRRTDLSLPENIKKILSGRFEGRVRFDEPMANHTSFRIGGPADAIVFPESVEDLMDLLGMLDKENVDWFVFGGGTNLLVKDGGIRGVVISPAPGLSDISVLRNEGKKVYVLAQSGVSLGRLCRFAADMGFSGVQFAAGIPGTVGGAVMMNAGTRAGEMSSIVASVDIAFGPGDIRFVKRKNMAFEYRSLVLPFQINVKKPGVIVSVVVSLCKDKPERIRKEMENFLTDRKKWQPGGFSAGSFFKNPACGPSAGELIDRAGLKGRGVGDAVVSENHANFIINRKNASAADVLALMEIIQNRVYEAFAVNLEPEVKTIGKPICT